MKPVVVAKILQEARSARGILAPPTGFITRSGDEASGRR